MSKFGFRIGQSLATRPSATLIQSLCRRQKKKMLVKKNLEGESSAEVPAHAASTYPAPPQSYAANGVSAQFGQDGQSRRYSHVSTGLTNQMSLNTASHQRGAQDQHQAYSSKSGVMKPTPLISQVRRGSVPYPPPQISASATYTMPSQRPPPPPSLSRTVSSSALARAQIPPHLVPDPSTCRRASMPANSHSISLGFFTPPRIGSKTTGPTGALSAIADDEHLLGPSVPTASTHAGHPLASGSAGTTSNANGHQTQPYGPLPNPEFSFGNSGPVERKSSLTSSASVSPHVTSQMFMQGAAYRNRMGSMASTLSQATTTDGASDSDWERTQQLVTPFIPSNGIYVYGDLPADAVQGGYREDGPDLKKRQLMVPLYHDSRRASA